MSIATQDDPTYEPFEPDYLRWILDHGFYDIADHYFRGQLIGAERLISSPKGFFSLSMSMSSLLIM